MIKCVECGKVIAGGGPRYSTPDSFVLSGVLVRERPKV